MTTETRTRPVSPSLRAELARAGVLHRELAAHLGIYRAELSWRMSGKRPWKHGELQKTADFLGVELAAIMEPDQRMIGRVPIHPDAR